MAQECSAPCIFDPMIRIPAIATSAATMRCSPWTNTRTISAVFTSITCDLSPSSLLLLLCFHPYFVLPLPRFSIFTLTSPNIHASLILVDRITYLTLTESQLFAIFISILALFILCSFQLTHGQKTPVL
jgi:hypothetical protein